MTKNENAISLRGISKMYRLYDSQLNRLKDALPLYPGKHHQEFWALQDITVDVPKGKTLGIVGVNGSGKSTLLQVVCGLLQPTRGNVHVHGRISALLELGSGFNPMLSGRENVYLQGAILGLSRQEINQRYSSIVEFADIGDFINQPVKSYSSGMMIRLAFSVAIQVDPEILIVDEALAVGDVFFQSKCFRKFEELRKQGVTILLVSHQLETIQALCDQAIFLHQGEIFCKGSPKEVVGAFQKHVGTNAPPTPLAPDEAPKQVPTSKAPVKTPTNTQNAIAATGQTPSCHGNGKARLTAYSVNGNQNCRETMVGSAKPLSIKVNYAVQEHITSPVVGIRIDTPSGFQVYGNNTTFANSPLEPCSPGDDVSLEFTQTLYLNQGSYMLTLVMAEWAENGNLQYVDRQVDAVHILISDGPYPYAGLCNFEGTVSFIPSQRIENGQ